MIAIVDLRDWLGNPDEPNVTAILTVLETMAVQLVEDETGRFFDGDGTTTHTEYIIGDGTRELRLNENATVITSVGRRRYIGDTFETITEGDTDGFEIRAPRSESGRATLLRKGALSWLDGYEHRVIYNFGYAANSEPLRIRQAVMDLVALKYHNRGREGLKGWSAGGVSWTSIFDQDDILSVAGLSQTLRLWRTRRMVLQ